MEKFNENIILLIVVGIMTMCMLATFLIIFVLLHRKKVLALENKLKEKEVQHQRELLEATIRSEAKERERLARNLHDDLGSLLNVIKINCFRMKQQAQDPDKVLKIIQENENIVKMTIETTRNLIRELSDHALASVDFITHLQQLCDYISRSGALTVKISPLQKEIFLPPEIQQPLSRIVKELLHNIMKHAHASSLHIQLKKDNNTLCLELHHNGQGINDEDIPLIYAETQGLGLKSIESRIQSLKGKIYYFYDGKSESKITIECPIEKREKDSHSHRDDQKLFLEGFARLLKEYDDFKIEITTTRPGELLSFLNTKKIDIVITDLAMPEMDGITLTEKIKKSFPKVKVIVLTMYDDERYLLKLIEKGANAFLTKDSDMENIINTIYGVYDDQYYFDNHASRTFLRHYLNQRNTLLQNQNPENKKLTEKEIDIIRLICQEYTSKEIADRLALSYSTVITYRERIMEKIGARNLAGIVVYAVKNGLI